mgnify:CR=1 FL=1
MRPFNLRLLFLIVALASGFATAYTETPDRFKQVDALFAEWDKTSSPGCALAIVQDGQVVYKRGYGMADLEHGVIISPESVFYIGSVSKQFVTMAILLLQEQGKLSVDDDIRKFLPDFPEYDRPITIRHLVHHTSGIRDYLTLWSLTGKSYLDNMDEAPVYDMIRRQKELNFSPGEQHLYSNSCYFLMSMIVQKASGQSLREYAEQHIFEPLGMNDTHFHDDNRRLIPNRAMPYMSWEGGFGSMTMRFDLVGSGGLYSTVEDLFLWDQNFYQNKLGKGLPSLIEAMHQNGRLNSGKKIDYAFALVNGEYRGLRVVQHGGALGGYRAQLMRFPDEKFSVIILSNLASFNPTRLSYKTAEIFLGDKMQPAEKTVSAQSTQPDSEPKTSAPTSRNLKRLAGMYFSEELQVSYQIELQDGKLKVKVPNMPTGELRAESNDEFSFGGVKLAFQKKGKAVSGFLLDAGRVKNLRFVKSK